MVFIIPFLLIGAAGAIAGIYGASKVAESEKILEDFKVKYDSAINARSQVITNLENSVTKYSQLQTKSANTVMQVILFMKEIGAEAEIKSLSLLIGFEYEPSKKFDDILGKSIIESHFSSSYWIVRNDFASAFPPGFGDLNRAVSGFSLYFEGVKTLENIQECRSDINREIENIITSKSNLIFVVNRLSEVYLSLEGIHSKVLIGLDELKYTRFDSHSTKDLQKLQTIMLLTKALTELIRIPVIDENWNLNPYLEKIQANYQEFQS